MITPEEAENLSQKAIEEYVKACKCQSREDIANVLMKLVSMSGAAMCQVVGVNDAVQRMRESTDYIAKSQAGQVFVKRRAN